MRKTPSKMHMHDMVTIDRIVFEIVGGWEAFEHPTQTPPPPPRVINFLKCPGSDKLKTSS